MDSSSHSQASHAFRTRRGGTISATLARVGLACIALACTAITGCSRSVAPSGSAASVRGPAAVTQERIIAADSDPGQWMTYGRTYDEQRFSPLTQINTGNVSRLGLAWYADFDSNSVQESTPIVVDGVIYTTTGWSRLFAHDARSGKLLWAYDPMVPRQWARQLCCGPVNRGVAAWNGRIYLGTLDGRLIAIDAKTGKPVWDVLTIDPTQPYSITGAPRIAKGKVFIGNGGADRNMRGYISAYDAESGKMVWRWYTVPGDPAKGFENDAMAMAAKTWNGQWWKVGGGGGTVWDGILYDPKTDLLYVGCGNGGPWSQEKRSPGGGDNLFLASIVALDPDDGSYRWHFQTVPGDTWDWGATAPMMTADLNIGGRLRHVLMQAPKNGYFYVLDAVTGEFISGKNYGPVNWSLGLDPKTGRARVNPAARYDVTGKSFIVMPSAGGASSWNPMSYSPQTGLIYIPARYNDYAYYADPSSRNGVAMDRVDDIYAEQGRTRQDSGYLLAWNPVTQTEAWRVQFTTNGGRGGGPLATAGGLVFAGTLYTSNQQGQPDETMVAYRADSGEKLWSMKVRTGVMAAPISYAVDGVQYIAVAVGRARGGGGDFYEKNYARLLVFALDGKAVLPPVDPPAPPRSLNRTGTQASAEVLARGATLYENTCAICHGSRGQQTSNVAPDLRYSAMLTTLPAFETVVLRGALVSRGMASFAADLDSAGADAVRNYLLSTATQAANAQDARGAPRN